MNILMMSVSKNFLFESVFYYILQEKFEDAKWVIRSRKLKKDRKHKVRKERYNRTNNDVQNITQKTKDRTTRTPQKTGDDISKIFPS